MGYKRKSKTFTLQFEDEEFDGLEIRTRSVSLGKFLDMLTLINAPMDKENVDNLFREFVGIVIEWNLEDDDDIPVPLTVDGLYSLDLDFVKSIIDAWQEAMEGISTPLEKNSPGGEQFQEELIPMETLPENRAS